MRLLFTCLFSIWNASASIAQQSDDLLRRLEQNLSRSEKIAVLNQLCEVYREDNPNNLKLYAEELLAISNGDSTSAAFAWGSYYLGDYFYVSDEPGASIDHFEMALLAFSQLDNYEGIGKASGSLANVYFYFDRYKNSLTYANIALEAYNKTNRLLKQANILALICDLYTYMEQYNQAIKFCVQSMKIKEDIQIDQNKEVTLNTIGVIYEELGSYNKAQEYLKLALVYAKKNNNPYNLATTYSNLGNYNITINRPDSALYFFNKALKIDEEANDQAGLAYSNLDVGIVLFEQGNLAEAGVYLEKAKELGIQQSMADLTARVYTALSKLAMAQQQYKKAIFQLKEALVIAQRVKSSSTLKSVYNNLAKAYDAIGDKDNALIYMRLYLLEAERKFKKDNIKSVAEVEAIYNIEKKEKEIDLLKKESAINDLKAAQRKFFLITAAASIVFLLILLFIFINRNKLKNRTNKKLQNQNKEILEQKEEIAAQKEELEEKGKTLITRNEQITDSINYARQIQESLLPEKGSLKNHFPKSFIYYKPKDIVSGDFYWHAQLENRVALAVIDCTGHGVPGAFMTVLANSLLNQIILESGIYAPDLVISLLDQKIQQSLHQNNLEYASADGLDIGLIIIDKNKKTAEFAGSKISLYQVQNNEINQIKADRYSVGSSHVSNKSFNKHEIALTNTAMLYLSTDGYQDQFGGPKDKKFMKKNFYNFLKNISHLPPGEQEHQLELQFQKWRGSNTQTDDILVIGISLESNSF